MTIALVIGCIGLGVAVALLGWGLRYQPVEEPLPPIEVLRVHSPTQTTDTDGDPDDRDARSR